MSRLTPILGTYAVLAVLALLFVYPVAILITGSLKADERVLPEAGTVRGAVPVNASLENYRDVFERAPFGRYLVNSLLITGAIVVLGLAVNAPAGYALARLSWPGRRWVLGLVAALLIVPLEAIAVPLFFEVTRLGWRDSYVVQIVPFVANAFSIYLFMTFFRDLPPELEEAARIDGASTTRTFLTIVVPNAKPAFAAAAILTFLMLWGLYLWPLMVTSSEAVRPLPLGVATFFTLPPLKWGDIFAFGVMMVAPVLVVFFVLQRWFVQGVARAGLKG